MSTAGETFPEGKLIRSIHGGGDTLKKTLIKLKQFEFTGYVKCNLTRDGIDLEGYLFIAKGMPVAAVYGHLADSRFIATTEGEKAVKLIWVDSYDKEANIEVRGRVDVDDILRAHPGLSISIKRSAGKKTRARKAISWGEDYAGPVETPEDKKRRDELLLRLNQWRKEGYVVYALEDAIQVSLDEAEALFKEFEENVRRLWFLQENLEEMETEGHETDVLKISAMFKNPMKITAIEAGLEELRQKILAEVEDEEKQDDTVSMLTRPDTPVPPDVTGPGKEQDVATAIDETEDKCSICGGNMSGQDECPLCGALRPESSLTMVGLDDLETTKKTGLIVTFTFYNFVVGESNRFSQAAALAVAKAQSSVYNPLFIHSGAGLGKTHLLNAIGNYVVENFTDKTVKYITTESFTQEFIEATKANKLKDFRNKYRKVDFLLLDDIHFLAGQEGVQDELFHTFNALHKDGKQIVMTSDRPVQEISGLKERLVSRFESGLVTDMQAPDFETRVSILKKKSEQARMEIGDDVLKHIARKFVSNIRVLEGALNKVIAYCELMNVLPGVSIVDDIIRDDIGQTDAPQPGPEDEPLIEESGSEKLKKSHSYLIEENRPERVFELFIEYLNAGYRGMAISRMNPKRLRDKFDFKDSQLFWLTDRDSSDVETMAPSLERIIYTIEDMLNTGESCILLIDGLEYLISNSNFEAVLRFLRSLIDDVSESNTIFLMSLTPETIEEQELKILEREMEVISY